MAGPVPERSRNGWSSRLGSDGPPCLRSAWPSTNSVKEALVQKYASLDPNRFVSDGQGWDRPADPNDPENHAKNRRVEVKVFSAEKP